MSDSLIPRGELTPGMQLFADVVESLARHGSRQIDEQEVFDDILRAVQKCINDPRTELPEDERLLANLGLLGVALLGRR